MAALYRQLLGGDWDLLDSSVRALHEPDGPRSASGIFSVRHGTSLLARFLLAAGNLPSAGVDIPVMLNVIPERDGERWRRSFADRAFNTHQRRGRTDLLVEDAGAVRISYRLTVREGALHFRQVGAALRIGRAGLPLPDWLAPQISAHERFVEDEQAIHVSVKVVHRLCGNVIEYEGDIRMENPNR